MKNLKLSLLSTIFLLVGCNSGTDSPTSIAKDTQGPVLHSTLPQNMTDDADTRMSIMIFFDEVISDNLDDGGVVVKKVATDESIFGGVEVRGATLIFTPDNKLEYSTEYSVYSFNSIKDMTGNRAPNTVDFHFTTKAIDIPVAEPTYGPEDSVPPNDIVFPSGEIYSFASAETIAFHALHHSFTPSVSVKLPDQFVAPSMDSIEDFVITKDKMVSINPGGEEYMSIMEGRRHGFENLTIALSNTLPGNGAPLHTHEGEEAHVLLHGKMRYFLGDTEFTVEAPYIINIPSMVPHAFVNIDTEINELIGVFPDANVWQYDILQEQVFEHPSNGREQSTSSQLEQLKHWHQPYQ